MPYKLKVVGASLVLAAAAAAWTYHTRHAFDVTGKQVMLTTPSSMSTNDVSYCLSKDWGNRLSLFTTPFGSNRNIRMFNSERDLVVLVKAASRGSIIVVYGSSSELTAGERSAVEDCAQNLGRAFRAADYR